MKKINNKNKSNFIKKLFVKLCRLIGFEIIDQSNLNLPVSNRSTADNLGHLGKNIISIPLGETKISRAVKSLDIIIKTCTSINLVTQNKKRIFEKNKSDYTFRTINSLINSLNFSKNFLIIDKFYFGIGASIASFIFFFILGIYMFILKNDKLTLNNSFDFDGWGCVVSLDFLKNKYKLLSFYEERTLFTVKTFLRV